MPSLKTIPLAVFATASILTAACSKKEDTVPPPATPDLSTSPIPSAPAIASSPDAAAGIMPPASAASAPLDAASMPSMMAPASGASMPN